MNWLKRLFGTRTDFEIMLEHIQRSHERDLDVIRLQMMTIDRVVAARYDRPTLAQEPAMAAHEINVDDLTDVNVDDSEWISRQ